MLLPTASSPRINLSSGVLGGLTIISRKCLTACNNVHDWKNGPNMSTHEFGPPFPIKSIKCGIQFKSVKPHVNETKKNMLNAHAQGGKDAKKNSRGKMDFLDFFSQESLVLRQNNHRHESECPTLPYMTVVPVPYCTTTLPVLTIGSGVSLY